MKTIDLSTSTVLVTGANRGLGRHLAEQLAARGATVYAGARKPETVDLAGVTPVRLDVTDPASVSAAAELASDVTVLVNNAGLEIGGSLLTAPVGDIRHEFDVNVFGTLDVVRAFVPVIEANGGGGILNILSVLSWFSSPRHPGYGAAKSAEWSMTNALRAELAPRGIGVSGLHVGYMDTGMTARIDDPKLDPAEVATTALDEFAAGNPEILADDLSRQVRAGLSGGVAALYPALA